MQHLKLPRLFVCLGDLSFYVLGGQNQLLGRISTQADITDRGAGVYKIIVDVGMLTCTDIGCFPL